MQSNRLDRRLNKGLMRQVGLTCRVGRSVTGHVEMIRDLLEGSDSILFLVTLPLLGCSQPDGEFAVPVQLTIISITATVHPSLLSRDPALLSRFPALRCLFVSDTCVATCVATLHHAACVFSRRRSAGSICRNAVGS